MTQREQVGQWIKARRSELAMTQDALATAARIHVRTIGNLESGRRELQVAKRGQLEQALGWGPGSLTLAYERGLHPGRAPIEVDDGEDPVLMEILNADLSTRDRAALIELRTRQIADLRREIARREIHRTGRRAG